MNLPAGFDPRRHTPAVIQKITESHGPGWEVEAIDPSGKRLTAVRQVEITEAHHADADTMILGLAQGTKPSDGDKIAARFEDAHPGWFLVDFEPFVGQATMRRLTANERRAREAIATGLRVKPWDVKVKAARGGGFNVGLPRSYEPGKQDEKLQEIAESVVGKVGWYVKTDPAKLAAQIIPGERPMFEPAYTYPVDAKIDKFALPIGLTLPEPGDRHDSLEVDLDDNVGLLLQGLAGSGKAQILSDRIPVPVSERFPDGWATIGELANGDEVLSPTGEIVPLAGFSDIHYEDTYEVELDDGQITTVGAQHSWEVSSYSARTRHYQRGRKYPDEPIHDATINRLTHLLETVEPGTYGTVADIAELASVPASRIYQTINDNDLTEAVVAEHTHAGGAYSTRQIRRYNVAAAAEIFRAEGFGQDITGRDGQNWANVRELAFAVGLGTKERVLAKVRDRLRRHEVPYRTVTERIEHKESLIRRSIKMYPVTEVLKGVISFYQASRG